MQPLRPSNQSMNPPVMFFYFCQTFLKRSPSEGKRPLPAVRRLVQQAGAGIQKGPAAGHGSIFAMISSGAAVHRLLLLGAVVPRHENALVGEGEMQACQQFRVIQTGRRFHAFHRDPVLHEGIFVLAARRHLMDGHIAHGVQPALSQFLPVPAHPPERSICPPAR